MTDPQTHVDWTQIIIALLGSGLLGAVVQWVRATAWAKRHAATAEILATSIELAGKAASRATANPLASGTASGPLSSSNGRTAVVVKANESAVQPVQDIKDAVARAESQLDPKMLEAVHAAVEKARQNAATAPPRAQAASGVLNSLVGLAKVVVSLRGVALALALAATLWGCNTTTTTTQRDLAGNIIGTTTVSKTQTVDPQSVALLEEGLKDSLSMVQEYKANEEQAKLAGDAAKQQEWAGKVQNAQGILSIALQAYESYQATHAVKAP